MKKRLGVSFAVLLLLACSTATQDSGHTALNGTWSFNFGQSDDARDVLRRSLREDDSADAAVRAEKKESAIQRLDEIFGAAELLEVKVRGPRISIETFNGQQLLFTDGRGAKKGHPERDATWEGGRLQVTLSRGDGTSIRQSFAPSADAKQLHITYDIEGPMFTRPVTIRRVYDRM